MIHPSYVDLMQVVNKSVEEGEEPVISSRYSIVMATARRARQIVAGDEPLVDAPYGRKALSVAVSELNEDRIKILTEDEKQKMEEKRLAESAKGETSDESGEKAEGDEPAHEEDIGSDEYVIDEVSEEQA